MDKKVFDVPCRIEVEHTFDSLHAHVELADGVVVHPGDQVEGAGRTDPRALRRARHVRAGCDCDARKLLERVWTRLTGRTEFMELLEFSFSERTRL